MSIDADRNKWTIRFLELAKHVASWSRDPSTKVGAVIVRPDKTIASVGFNGFARGVKDTPERYEDRQEKYPRIIHAEINAILNCRERPVGYTIFVHPLAPCAQCAGAIIQSGIIHVVAFTPRNERSEAWQQQMDIAAEMFEEAGVDYYTQREYATL
jgi:dCMP deaminase